MHLARKTNSRTATVSSPEGVLTRIELDLARLVSEMGKAGLPVVAEGHHPPRDRHRFRLLELVLPGRVVAAHEIAGPVGEGKALTEGIDTARAEGVELLEAPSDELIGSRTCPRRLRRIHV